MEMQRVESFTVADDEFCWGHFGENSKNPCLYLQWNLLHDKYRDLLDLKGKKNPSLKWAWEKKTPVTFHTGWFIGILIAYYNPYKAG